MKFGFKFSALVKDLDCRFSDLYLKKDGYREQLLGLLNSLLKPLDKKFLKERITGSLSKCAFFELSRIINEEDSCETEFMKSVTGKTSGLTLAKAPPLKLTQFQVKTLSKKAKRPKNEFSSSDAQKCWTPANFCCRAGKLPATRTF